MTVKAFVPYHGLTMPHYIDQDLWDVFAAQRVAAKNKKVQFSQHAAELLMKKLIRFKCAGYDPNVCLEKSIERGYEGVFPVEEELAPSKAATATNHALEQIKRDEKDRPWDTPEAHAARRKAMEALGRPV